MNIFAIVRHIRPQDILDILLANANIASRDQIPVCQDTGIAVVFVDLGQGEGVR